MCDPLGPSFHDVVSRFLGRFVLVDGGTTSLLLVTGSSSAAVLLFAGWRLPHPATCVLGCLGPSDVVVVFVECGLPQSTTCVFDSFVLGMVGDGCKSLFGIGLVVVRWRSPQPAASLVLSR